MTSVRFRSPSWPRLKHALGASRRISLLRVLEYERLAQLGLTGRVLDYGGGTRTNYSDRVASWGGGGTVQYESLNIDSATAPTFLVEVGQAVPVPDAHYDTVLTLNTLEHIYDTSTVVREMARVLRPGGRLIIIVPFIFRVHGHPNDFHRSTPSYWNRFLGSHGFEAIQVEALHWGPFSTAQMVSGLPGPFKSLRRSIALCLDYALMSRRYGSDKFVAAEQDDPVCAAALGYFIEARRGA